MMNREGIRVSVIKLVRRFQRKIKRITITQTTPSRIASRTLSMAALMKSAWRKMSVTMVIRQAAVPEAGPACVDAFTKHERVGAGCFWTERMTDRWPSMLASPAHRSGVPNLGDFANGNRHRIASRTTVSATSSSVWHGDDADQRFVALAQRNPPR